MKVQNIRTFINVSSKGVPMDKISKTEPDASLTVQEILKNHLRPSGIDINHYDPSGQYVHVSRLNQTEKRQFLFDNHTAIQELEQQHQENTKAIEAETAKQMKKSEEESEAKLVAQLKKLSNEANKP